MSHISKIELEVKDLDALDNACRVLGLELVKGQKEFKHFASRKGHCDHVIRIPGNTQAYEIGVVRSGDKAAGYSLQWDSFAGGYGLVEKVGTEANKLKQSYAAQVASKNLRLKGFRVSMSQKEDGEIVVLATR